MRLDSCVRYRLGKIDALLEVADDLDYDFIGLQDMVQLPGGVLAYLSKLDLDTDGKRDPKIHYEPTHQDAVSLHGPIDSNVLPFFVLPGGFADQVGIKLGDVAAILYQDRLAFAIYADIGPHLKIGEGSIELHRLLGYERVAPDGRIRDVGIDADVLTLVFPGTGATAPLTVAQINAVGVACFKALGGLLDGTVYTVPAA